MSRNAAKRILFSIENKSVFGIYLIRVATETVTYVIYYLVTLYDLSLTAIEVGVLTAVPEVNILDLKTYPCLGRFDLLKLILFLIVKGINYLL